MLGQAAGKYGYCRLLLDELPEFGTRNLETLRQPLEDRVITISRATGSLTFPASFILTKQSQLARAGVRGSCPYSLRREAVGLTSANRISTTYPRNPSDSAQLQKEDLVSLGDV